MHVPTEGRGVVRQGPGHALIMAGAPPVASSSQHWRQHTAQDDSCRTTKPKSHRLHKMACPTEGLVHKRKPKLHMTITHKGTRSLAQRRTHAKSTRKRICIYAHGKQD